MYDRSLCHNPFARINNSSNRIQAFPEPNHWIFFFVLLFAPWHVLGIQLYGRSIFLSFAIIFIDTPFWANTLNKLSRASLSFRSILQIAACAAALFLFLVMANGVSSLALKIGGALLYTFYVISGLNAFGQTKFRRGLTCGVVSSVIFAIIQFVEANYFHTTHLTKDFFINDLHNGLILGLGYDAGMSYAPMELLPGAITRVSGTAGEPGYYSLLLIAMLPVFYRNWRISLCISIGLFVSFSKVTLFSLIGLLVALVLIRFFRFTSSAILLNVFIAYNFLALLLRLRAGRAENLSVTIYDRFSGYFIWELLDWPIIILGTGYRGACDFMEKSIHPYYRSLISRQAYGEPFCSAVVHSNIGSFQVETGLLGLLIALTLLVCIERQLKAKIWRGKCRREIYFCLVAVVFASLSIHYTVFYPSLYILIGYTAYKIIDSLQNGSISRTA